MLSIKQSYTEECNPVGQLLLSKASQEDSNPSTHKIEEFECPIIGLRDSTDKKMSVNNVKKNHNLKNESSFETEVLNVTEQSISTAFGSTEASCSRIKKSGEEDSL